MRLLCKVVLEGMHSTVVSNLALMEAGSESAAHTATSLGIASNTHVGTVRHSKRYRDIYTVAYNYRLSIIIIIMLLC